MFLFSFVECVSGGREEKSCVRQLLIILSRPQKFDIEMDSVEKHFWKLQKQLHPDLYYMKSKVRTYEITCILIKIYIIFQLQTEKEISSSNSTMVNQAYAALKQPRTRVKYLLELHGIDALSEESKRAVDPEILIEILEKR